MTDTNEEYEEILPDEIVHGSGDFEQPVTKLPATEGSTDGMTAKPSR